MSMDASDTARSHEAINFEIVERLRARLPEIRSAVYAHIEDTVPIPASRKNPEYQAGLLAAIEAVVEYSLEGIEQGLERLGSIPQAAIDQARRAARAGVSLGTVLRRYVAGHRRLGEFIVEEARRSSLGSDGSAPLLELRRMQETLLERLTAAIEREYDHELETAGSPAERRRIEVVRRLLNGGAVAEASLVDLEYDIHSSWHLGVIATGARAHETLERLTTGLDRQSLPIVRRDGAVWGWLGGQREFALAEVERLLVGDGHAGVSLAVGEPGEGLDGWRLTHHQAREALRVAMRGRQMFTRYADSPLLAAALQNETLAKSLKAMFLAPLDGRSGGPNTALRETLRAYIDAECNASSASSTLKVRRQTVRNRLQIVEKLIGRPLHKCLAEVDVALRLEELRSGIASCRLPPRPRSLFA
jgi:hypothetical protein